MENESNQIEQQPEREPESINSTPRSNHYKQKSLAEQYSEATATNEAIQRAYQNLWRWYDCTEGQSSFFNYKLEGPLKKRVSEIKLFQTKVFPTRYYLVDFANATWSIMNSKADKEADRSKRTIIPFRNITECFLPLVEYEEKIKKVCSKKYNFPFFVRTVDRLFELYASTEKERQLWICAFIYLIKSTAEVQKIITANNQRMSLEIQK